MCCVCGPPPYCACLCSAVLLVDTSVPVWPILHSSTGWQQLQQQSKGTPGSGSTGGCGGSNGNSSSSIGRSLWALLDSESMRSRCPGGVTAKEQVLQQVMNMAEGGGGGVYCMTAHS